MRPILVILDRRSPSGKQLAAVLAELPSGVTPVLVFPRADQPGSTRPAAPGLVDPGGHVAQAVRIHRPRDAGRPVGYAVIDRQRRVGYVTLEPQYLDHGFEIGRIARVAR